MSIRKYIKAEPLNKIIKYSTHKDYMKLGVAFSGAPKKHPFDKEKLILISDPFSTHTLFYEFTVSDILHVDELPHLVTESGDSVSTVRIWVRKGSLGVKYEPFVVEDTLDFLKDLDSTNKQKK
ncbi:MAG: hypothetical protein JW822_11405 [Spirochaetales bacterium]|nr:hypothetical protein [Spirochaetales bacterium]